MGHLIISLRRLGSAAAFATLLAVMLSARTAQAASPWEMTFWLFGPSYEGRLAPCQRALGVIATQFHEKESEYWNSALTITAYRDIHEIAFRPWQSDNIPRRYCSGKAKTSDGKIRTVNFSIIEDGGFASFDQGVEWCVSGLDRNWAYNPACRLAGP